MQSARKRNSTNGPRGPVFLPPGAREVTPNHAFNGKRFGFMNHHGTSEQLSLEGFEHFWKLIEFVCHKVVAKEIKTTEPKCGESVQHLSLLRNGVRKNTIERGDTIRSDQKQMLPQIEDFPNFSRGTFGDSGKIKGVNKHRILSTDNANARNCATAI
jgi:hypothetical protein